LAQGLATMDGMFSCCGNQQAVIADDVAVAPDTATTDTTAQVEKVGGPTTDKPAAAGAKPAATPTPWTPSEEKKFSAKISRDNEKTPWGVDLTSDSEKSLSVVRVAPEGAVGAYNKKASTPIQPGDVIVSIEQAKSKLDMVNNLKTKNVVQVDIVRYTRFEAQLKKNSAGEALSMDVNDAGPKTLVIQKISPVGSALTRYNEEHYLKPIIEGDLLVEVNGKDSIQDMVREMQKSTTLNVKVKRASA